MNENQEFEDNSKDITVSSYLSYLNYDKFSFAEDIECNYITCGRPNICLNEGFCKCSEDFANFVSNQNDLKKVNLVKSRGSSYCGYKRKKQLIAFLLELFLVFGIGHIYLENYVIGVIKFLIFTYFWILRNFCCSYFNPKQVEESRNLEVKWYNLLLMLITIIWYFLDIILLAMNKYTDGNYISPVSW